MAVSGETGPDSVNWTWPFQDWMELQDGLGLCERQASAYWDVQQEANCKKRVDGGMSGSSCRIHGQALSTERRRGEGFLSNSGSAHRSHDPDILTTMEFSGTRKPEQGSR